MSSQQGLAARDDVASLHVSTLKGEPSISSGKKMYSKLPQADNEVILNVEHIAESASRAPNASGCVAGEIVASASGSSSASGTDYSSDYDQEKEDEEGDSEYDEYICCNVCDRGFSTARQLVQHQLNKRHFGCSVCDALFPSLLALKEHKEGLEHWSDGEGPADKESESDDDQFGVQPPCEELERLL